MEKIIEGFYKAAKVNYLDLFGLRRGASKVVKDLKPKVGAGTNVTKAAPGISKHTQNNLSKTKASTMSKSKWQSMMAGN